MHLKYQPSDENIELTFNITMLPLILELWFYYYRYSRTTDNPEFYFFFNEM